MPYTYEYNNSFPFAAYLTNLGKYNEGLLVGKWVEFPTTQEDVAEALKEIEIGSKDYFGCPYEEFFITDYDDYTDCHLCKNAGEFERLDELNYLASLLDDMNEYDYEMFCAVMESGEYGSSLQDMINIANSIDAFCLLDGVFDEKDYGYYLVSEGLFEVPDYLENYIDYEALGRDISMGETGTFTSYGYLMQTGYVDDCFYDGIEVPEEYCVIVANSEYEEEEED